MTIRKKQPLQWICKKVNQNNDLETVKSKTQTDCLPYYTSIMRKQNIIFKSMTNRKNQL